jgi:hypothetical protein
VKVSTTFARGARAAVVLCLAASVSACALLIPQVQPAKLKQVDPLALTSCYLTVGATTAERTAAAAEIAGTPSEATTARIALCWAYTYAEQWKIAYTSAARQHSGTRAIASAIAIPAAGVAVFKGATEENSRNSTTGLIVGAASLYAAVSILTSLSREEVYLNGALAMSCMRSAAQPMLQATARLSAMERAKADLSESLKKFDALVASSGLDLKFAQNADLVVSRANAVNALNKGEDLTVAVHGFAEALRERVETIRIQVAKLIKSSEPSPQTMLSILSSIGSITGGLQAGFTIPKPETKAPGAEGVTEAGRTADLVAAQADLDRKTTVLQEELKLVSDSATQADQAAKAQDCRPEGVKSTFSVSPDASALVVAQGATTKLTVTASDGFPSLPVLEANDGNYIEVEPYSINTAAPNSDQFILVVRGKNPTGTNPAVLKITDHANEVRKTLAISVTATAAPPAKPEKPTEQPSAPPSEPLTQTEKDTLAASMVLVGEMQCVVDTPVDCKVSTKTRDAIASYRKKKQLSDSRDVDQKLVASLLMDLDGDKASCKDKGKDLEACK